MRRAIAAVAVLAISLTVGAGFVAAKGQGHGKVFIEGNCERLQEKPRHIDLACGKSNRHEDDRQLKRIHYRGRQYGNHRAGAHGRLAIRRSSGKVSAQVNLRFKRLRDCGGRRNRGDKDKRGQAYRLVTVKLQDPLAGVRGSFRERLGCG